MTTKESNKNRWLTIADVEREYGFSRTTQHKMRKEKIVPFSKIGDKQNSPIRYDRLELDKWLEDNKRA